jgi:hypothetical protein
MRFVDKDKQGEDSYAISLPLDTNQNNCTDSNSLLLGFTGKGPWDSIELMMLHDRLT